MGMEDAAVLSSLLYDDCVQGAEDLGAVFAAFDASRRQRDQWLVQSSRRAADIYEWRSPELGRDYDRMKEDIRERQARIWNFDLDRAIREAREDLGQRLMSK
jgi:salicylate hydroxylase